MKDSLQGLAHGQVKGAEKMIEEYFEKSAALKAEILAAPVGSKLRAEKSAELLEMLITLVNQAVEGEPPPIRELLRLISHSQMKLDHAILSAQGVDVTKLKFLPLVK